MGQYVLDLFRIRAASELRVGAADAFAQIHVLDLIPHNWRGRPYVPAEGLHGRYRSALDWILGLPEGSSPGQCWHPDAPTARIFGTLGTDAGGQRRGRLRFGHAMQEGTEAHPVGVYARIRLHPRLGTVEQAALFDEMVLKEGWTALFTRSYRAPDLEDAAVEEDLGLLDLVDEAFNRGVLAMGAGGALGRGRLRVERLRRVRVRIDGGRPAISAEGAPVRAGFSPAFFAEAAPERLVQVPAPRAAPAAGGDSLLAVGVRNLGQLWPGRELIAGSQLFGALATLALELDGTLPEARTVSDPREARLVLPEPVAGAPPGSMVAPEQSRFARLYRLWKDARFRVAPLLPVGDDFALRAGEEPLLRYNEQARRLYVRNGAYRHYDSQVLHQHHRRDRDLGTVAQGEGGGTLRSSIETRPLQRFFGFVLLRSDEARSVFTDLLSFAPLADLGLSKHAVVAFEPLGHAPLGELPRLQGTPHLITRKLDAYMSGAANGARFIAHRWTGAFPCAAGRPHDPGGAVTHDVRDGWAVPNGGARSRPFALDGAPAHAPVAPAEAAGRALLEGVGRLAEWRSLGYGQLVWVD